MPATGSFSSDSRPTKPVSGNSANAISGRRKFSSRNFSNSIPMMPWQRCIWNARLNMKNNRQVPPEGWLDIWNRWDAVRYIEVAQLGYGGEASGEHRFMIVFLPLYPLTIYLAHFLITNWHAAAVVVSNLCCAGAFTYCFLLTEK